MRTADGSGPEVSRGAARSRPRVVILDDGASQRVAVLELPETTSVGADFAHSGQSWRVTATRTHRRVLIAEPVNS